MNSEIKVLLVDDEAVIRDIMKEILAFYEFVQVKGEAGNKEETMAFLQQNQVDVVFTDIQMEGGSGFELAEEVHRIYPKILVVFLTGHADFALDGYSYGPIDFLLKPVSKERLEQALKRISERLWGEQETHRGKSIGIQTEDGYKIFKVQEIAYFEKEGRKVRIVEKNGVSVKTGESMQELEEICMEYDFFRCHQSYLVPLADIRVIRQDTFGRTFKIGLCDLKTEIPLSRRKYYEIRDILQKRGVHGTNQRLE